MMNQKKLAREAMALQCSKQLLLMMVVAVFHTKAVTQPMSRPNCPTKAVPISFIQNHVCIF